MSRWNCWQSVNNGERKMITNYKDMKWKENGKLKLLIIVGTRPEIIRLAPTITK